MSKFRPYNLRQQVQGPSVPALTKPGSSSREGASPYFLLFATDADGELKIPIREAATYRTLYEGHPARLRKCKVMVKVFGRTHWFLVTTRYSDGGARNRSIYETMGFAWNGPVTAMRLEKRGKCTPAGILSSEHHQAAVAAIERYLEVMSAEMSRPDEGKWRKSIIDSDSDP